MAICVFGSASPALAQAPDSGVPEQAEAEKKPPKKERSRLVQPTGDEADNEQLGGEPSLTEVRGPPSPTEGETESPAEQGQGEEGPSAQPKEEDCDLDCIEAELDKQEEKEKRKKRTVAAGVESGSLTTAVDAEADAGDTMASEPSTTSLAEVLPDADERKLPLRLGPVRLKVGKTDDWIGFGFASQLEFDYKQQFPGGGLAKRNRKPG